MAADTAIVRTMAQYYSSGVTTAPPLVNYAPPDWSVPAPVQAQAPRRLSVTIGGVLVHFDGWASVLALLVNNRDPVNYVEIAYTYPSPTGGAKNNVVSLLAGSCLVLPGPFTLGNNATFTAFGGTVIVDYAILGT